MLTSLMLVPGEVNATDPITITDGAPRIFQVHSVLLYQTSAGMAGEVDADDIAAALENQLLETEVAVGGAVTETLGHDAAGPPAQLETSAAANTTIGGIQAHVGSGVDAPVAMEAPGANPVITIPAAEITVIDEDSFSLDLQDVENGELLVVRYLQIGVVPRVA
jgi:hypothetical protein